MGREKNLERENRGRESLEGENKGRENRKRDKNTQLSAPGIAGYLKSYRGPIGLFLLFIRIYTAVFYLYRLPVEAVLYGALLYAAAAAPFLVFQYRGSRKKREELRTMQRELLNEPNQFYLDSCPAPGTAFPTPFPSNPRRLIALLGLLCLAAGYYLALSLKNPILAINGFFSAALYTGISACL